MPYSKSHPKTADLEWALWGFLGGERLPFAITRDSTGADIIPASVKVTKAHVRALVQAGLDVDMPTSPVRIAIMTRLSEHYRVDILPAMNGRDSPTGSRLGRNGESFWRRTGTISGG